MADETGDKTEAPSQRKIDEARRHGDVAKSPEVGQWASMAAVTTVIICMGGSMARDLAAKLLPFIDHPDAFDMDGGNLALLMRQAFLAAAPIIIIVMSAAAAAGVAGNLLQTGFLLSVDKLMPDASRLSPMKGLERLFGIDGLIGFAKSVVKIVLVVAVAWISLKPHLTEFENLTGAEPVVLLDVALAMVRALFMGVLILFGAGAILDWFIQRMRFMSRMRMSKQDMKEEHRQNEGDPHIKARLRQMRMERARRRMMQNVAKASVVVMNPTHYAVALRYEPGETAAPQCVAKGLDSLALKIREVAESNGVPVVENPPLARALYASVDLDESIPREHYEAVAKVIGFVMQSKRRRAGRKPGPQGGAKALAKGPAAMRP